MEGSLDIQRDHVRLIDLCMETLNKNGKLFFSNNFKRFVLNPGILERYRCKDLSKLCLPEDFKRHPNIHHCWLIERL